MNKDLTLIYGFIMIITGYFLIIEQKLLVDKFSPLIGGILVIMGIVRLYSVIKEKNKKIKLSFAILNIVTGIIMIIANNYILKSIVLIYQIYLLLTIIIHMMNFYLHEKYHMKGKIKIVLSIIGNVIFSIVLSLNQEKNIIIIMSLYLLVFGISKVLNYILEITHFRNKVYLPIPVFFTLFIPKQIFKNVDNKINFDYIKSEDSDIKVIIHFSKGGTSTMGHIEISYKNKTYSYGNYDKHSRNLFGSIGDGVIMMANTKKYIKYCVEKKNRCIVEYGIKLTDKDKKIVQKRLEKLINEDTIDYYPDRELYDKGLIEKNKFNDMSSDIYKYAEGKFKKITKGKEKKFFLFSTNCAMVASHLLSSVDKKIIAINGLITPGTYYDYLDEKLRVKKSNVIYRKVYTKDNYKEKLS